MNSDIERWLEQRSLATQTILRQNFHTTYQLAENKGVLRVSPVSTQIKQEIALLQWLVGKVPVVEVIEYDEIGGQALLHTAWIEGEHKPVNGAFADTLAKLHQLDYPGQLGPLNPIDTILHAFAAETHPRYQELVQVAGEAVQRIHIPFSQCNNIVHADAYPSNAITDQKGTVHLLDFERVARGPAFWDCALIWVACNRMGDGNWQEFCEGYNHPELFDWDENTPIVTLALIWAFSWCCGRKETLPESWHNEMLSRFAHWRNQPGTKSWKAL